MSHHPIGFFGPSSVSWQVHREVTVLFGGARALLMQAAHPLVIAGAAESGFYERNPWRRLDRTLRLTYAITFGSEEEAQASADRINDVHTRVNGIDAVTGKPYDALDPDLLLWVHACLVDSALLFEHLTVGKLDAAGRERFHEEQLLAAEKLKLPREKVPGSVPALRRYIADTVDSADLIVTPAALRLAEIFRNPPVEAEWRPVLRAVAWWAFGSLPPKLREGYGVQWNPAKEAALRTNLGLVRLMRPLLPPKFRFIEPYNQWLQGSEQPVTDANRVAQERAEARLAKVRAR